MSQLKIGLLNSRSVRNKMVTINERLVQFDLDILCLTETWMLDSDISVVSSALPGSYSIISVPRPGACQGGGVAVIYSRAITNISRTISCDLVVTSFEFVEVLINLHRQVIRIAVVYRPGSDRLFINEFGEFLEAFTEKSGLLLICGDFNFWIDQPSLKPYSTEFLELIDGSNFVNHVTTPTHVAGHILDLVLSPSDCDRVADVEVDALDPVLSDHALVTFSFGVPRPPSYNKTIKFRNYANVNHTQLSCEVRTSLSSIDLSDLSTDELVTIHNQLLSSIFTRHCPVIEKRIIVRDDCPWYDSSITSLRRHRRKAERDWRMMRTGEARTQYVNARNAVLLAVKQRKVDYYRSKIVSCGGDQRKLYGVVRNLLGKNCTSSKPTSVCDKKLASDFASFFSSKVSDIRDELHMCSVPDEFSVGFQIPHNNPLVISTFQSVEVNDVLSYIRNSKKTFCNLDPLDVSRLQDVYEHAADLVCRIINKSFSEGTFPQTEKSAIVHPLLKKPGLDMQDLSSYRPVSNLSFLSKIMERAILDQLLPVLEANMIIPDLQSAYRKHHSTETALCRVHNDLVMECCAGNSSLLVLLDLSAAFDTVDHQLLLDDLQQSGICDKALALIKSYLSDRTQSVMVGDAVSDLFFLLCGVPQGSVLGPILFAAYTSSLASLLRAHGLSYHFYADDTQIYVRINNVGDIKDRMKVLMSDIKIWMVRRKLKLNDGKTELIVIHGNRRSSVNDFGSLNIGDTELSPVVCARNLGVFFDSKLSFNKQIDQIVKTCNYQIRNLYAVRKLLDKQCLLTLIHSQILSRIDYCNSLWFDLPKYLLRKLQSVMNRAARLVFGLPPRTPTTSSLIELHWLPIKARIEFKLCLMVYKGIKFGEPKYLAELLLPQQDRPCMSLRSEDDPLRLDEPTVACRSAFVSRAFSHTAPRLYNRLPDCIRQSTSVESFKKLLKTFMFQRCYDLENGVVTEDYRV